MEFSLKFTILFFTILFTGISAGLCFTWSNSVTPGIGRLDNLGFLQSFQHMNRVIINPTFLIVFFTPLLLNLINIYLVKNTSITLMWLLILATVIYFFGVVLITIFGNVPLNEMLDKIDLSVANNNELRNLRETFEDKWNRLHLIRTIASSVSFSLLIITFSIKF